MAVGLRLPKVGVNQYRTHATARNTMWVKKHTAGRWKGYIEHGAWCVWY